MEEFDIKMSDRDEWSNIGSKKFIVGQLLSKQKKNILGLD